jgi:hypothetical protein
MWQIPFLHKQLTSKREGIWLKAVYYVFSILRSIGGHLCTV